MSEYSVGGTQMRTAALLVLLLAGSAPKVIRGSATLAAGSTDTHGMMVATRRDQVKVVFAAPWNVKPECSLFPADARTAEYMKDSWTIGCSSWIMATTTAFTAVMDPGSWGYMCEIWPRQTQ